MRHLKRGRKLNRTHEHRKAMLENLAASILTHHRVKTGHFKALEVRRVVERLITYAKRGTLHDRRLAACIIKDKVLLKKLFDEIAPKFKDRNGGYTRVLKFGCRPGDASLVSIIELVGLSPKTQEKLTGEEEAVKEKKEKKKI